MNAYIHFVRHASPINFCKDLSSLYVPKTHTFLDKIISRASFHFKHKINLRLYIPKEFLIKITRDWGMVDLASNKPMGVERLW
jgi:hypothetical protein